MLRLYYRTHQQADTTGGHSTEENLLTIQDLSNIFVDSEDVRESLEVAGQPLHDVPQTLTEQTASGSSEPTGVPEKSCNISEEVEAHIKTFEDLEANQESFEDEEESESADVSEALVEQTASGSLEAICDGEDSRQSSDSLNDSDLDVETSQDSSEDEGDNTTVNVAEAVQNFIDADEEDFEGNGNTEEADKTPDEALGAVEEKYSVTEAAERNTQHSASFQ